MNKAVSIRAKHANPLFEQWLTEWNKAETDEIKRNIYANALQSLQKYPLPLKTSRECLILQGFGEKLCKKLDNKLNNSAHNAIPETEQVKRRKISSSSGSSTIKKATYTPAYRSGGYAILCALHKLITIENSKEVTKKELVVCAQPFCDKSFTKSEPNTFYTAWSSMSTLIAKLLVAKHGNPAKFTLTDSGTEIAKEIHQDALRDPENAHFVNQPLDKIAQTVVGTKKRTITKKTSSNSLPSSSQGDNSQSGSFVLSPGTFKVWLLVDKQETSGTTTTKKSFDEILLELNNHSVNYEIRHLKVGDYAWICRETTTGNELMLPYIIERKRMDDFGSSIKDGRFHEQKFRLKQSGIQHLMYLVENYGNNTHCGLPLASIYQAATNTLVQDDFAVKFTRDIRETAQYLATFTTLLTRVFSEKTIASCPKELLEFRKSSSEDDVVSLMSFEEFNLGASKNKALKVSDMFVKQLLQLSGVSVDKALAIVGKYSTPRMLRFAYEACEGEKEMELLLANDTYGDLGKKIGPVVSQTVYQLYNYKQY